MEPHRVRQETAYPSLAYGLFGLGRFLLQIPDSYKRVIFMSICGSIRLSLDIYSEPCKQSIAAYLKNRQFFVLITRQLRGLYGASTEEGRDITMQSNLEHSRRRICNAVNVDFLAEIATQTKATKLAANRFEEYSPQYLLYI